MRRLLFPLFAVGIALAIYYWFSLPKLEPVDTWISQPGGNRMRSNSVPRLPPGTRVGDGPPSGWAQIILKTRPNVSSGDIDNVDAATLTAINKFSTTVVGRGEPDPENAGKFRVGGFAAGLGTRVGDEDVIITSKTAAEHGVELTFFEAKVLEKREEEHTHFASPAATRTMVIVDLPAVMLRGTDHVKVVMRYAAMVDPNDGRIETLLWPLDKVGQEYAFSGDSVIRMEPNQTMSWELHVDTTKYAWGLPTPETFAGTSLPRGESLPAPESLKKPAALKRFTIEEADELEAALRELATGKKPAQPTASATSS